jgi:riboflavin synthase
MFTGIVEELGVVEALEELGDAVRLTVRGPLVVEDAAHGDSIAVNGCCLTVAGQERETFTADVMRETLDKTSLGALVPGSRVNLERAVTATKRLGGHLVQGHVDGVGSFAGVSSGLTRFAVPAALTRYLVPKGSVTVDGVSLTVVDVGPDWFTVGLIPTTLSTTTLGGLAPADPVNIEADVVAKYVEKLLGGQR